MTDTDRYRHSAEHLRKKLNILIAHDVDVSTFGAGKSQGAGHDFKLRPTLTEEELAQFEKRHGVALPPSYRAFIKHVGNGGAGPGYGMGSLADGYPKDAGERHLATEFPNTQPIVDDDEYDDDEEAPYADVPYGMFPGCLCLCHHGCGIYDFLIVTGPCRGQIWTDDRCSDGGVYPSSTSFWQWYSNWIDASLLKLYQFKLSLSQYIQFEVDSADRFAQFLALFDHLRADQNGEGLQSDSSVYLARLDDAARAHYWFPTEADRKQWDEQWKATPVDQRWNDPSLKRPREFDSVIRGMKSTEIQLERCAMVDERTARLEYVERSHSADAADINITLLVESYGFSITETGDGRGPRPHAKFSYSGI